MALHLYIKTRGFHDEFIRWGFTGGDGGDGGDGGALGALQSSLARRQLIREAVQSSLARCQLIRERTLKRALTV